MQGVVDLVEHRRFELVQFVGAPPEPDLLLQLESQALALKAIEAAALLQFLDQGGHTPLLVPHRMAHNFGGVGGEHQPQVEGAQQLLQLGWRHIQTAQAGEQLAKGGRVGLVGQGRQEGIAGAVFLVFEAVEVGVLLDVLLEDVDQLEIKRKGPGRGDCLGQIHLADQLHDRPSDISLVWVTQLLEAQQSLGLLGGALAAQHRLPEIFN